MLFLDRGHDRARAYIERARGAQAERQRESEELLHRGMAAFDRGETTGAAVAAERRGIAGRLARSGTVVPGAPRPARAPARVPPAAGRVEEPHGAAAIEIPPARPPRQRWRFYAVAMTSVVAVTLAAWRGARVIRAWPTSVCCERAPGNAPATPACGRGARAGAARSRHRTGPRACPVRERHVFEALNAARHDSADRSGAGLTRIGCARRSRARLLGGLPHVGAGPGGLAIATPSPGIGPGLPAGRWP